MKLNTCTEQRPDNVVYLADVRKRFHHSDEPSDPPPGAAAARSCELTFLPAVATAQAARLKLVADMSHAFPVSSRGDCGRMRSNVADTAEINGRQSMA